MKVEISYRVEEFNQFNDASEGWRSQEQTVDIEDGGKDLGETILGLLAWGAKITDVRITNTISCPVCDSFGCCPPHVQHTYKKGCLCEKDV